MKLSAILLFPIVWICFSIGELSCMMDSMIAPCKSGGYLSIDSLYDFCKPAESCGKKIDCEGKTLLIKGYIDYGNVFDKTNYPSLPYQKFLMTNSDRSKSLDVWVASECSEVVFKKIFRQQSINSSCEAYIRGTLTGFDMHVMGACHRGLKLNLTDGNSLCFDTACADADNRSL